MSTTEPKPIQKQSAGRKRGRARSARTIDEAGYGEYHDEAAFLVHETFNQLRGIPNNSEDRDQCQEEKRWSWLHFLGPRILTALQDGDAALFEGIAVILRDHRVNLDGDWTPVDRARLEAAVIAQKQREKKLSALTTEQFAKMMAPFQIVHGGKRDTNKRIAKDTGVQIIARKGGRKPGKKRP